MENLRKYFDTLPVVHVVEDGLGSVLGDSLVKSCSKYVRITISELLAGGELSKIALSVIEFASLKQEKIQQILAKIHASESLLVCNEHKEAKTFEVALQFHFFGVMSRNPDEHELVRKLKLVLMSISAKQKERIRTDNINKIVDAPGVYYCIKRGGQIVFANQNMMVGLGKTTMPEINSLGIDGESIVSFILSTNQEGDLDFLDSDKSASYSIMARANGTSEMVFACYRQKGASKQSGLLSHVEFIEILKDSLIHRNVSEESIFALTIKLENSDKITQDHGSEFFYTYFEKFSGFCSFFFENAPKIFWFSNYLVILPQERDVDKLKERADELFSQASSYQFEASIVPIINMGVLVLDGMDISEALSIIENLYTKSMTMMQSSQLALNRSSGTNLVADGQMAMYHLQNIAGKDREIKLLNIYKGMSIGGSSSITKIEDGDIYIKVEKMQKYLMYLEKGVTIQSKHLPKEIYAEVRYIDPIEMYAIIKNPVFLEFSVNSRKSTRVQCDTRIPITLTCGKIVFTGEIFDISSQAIAIKYKNKVNNEILHSDVRLNFLLPSREAQSGVAQLSVKGNITVIKSMEDHTRIISSIRLEPSNEGVIMEYIYARQKELIIELKKLGSATFS